MSTDDLSGEWRLHRAPLRAPGSTSMSDEASWRSFGGVVVPGQVHLQIGLADPFADLPEVTEVNDYEWLYSRSFGTPVGSGRSFVLFEGTDYFCDVWVNGVHVGHHEGMYSDWEVEVTDVLRPGGGEPNELVVAVSCPWRVIERTFHLSAATFEDSFDSRTEYLKGNHIMQWDGWPMRGQTLLPFGLWRTVRLDLRSGPTLTRISAGTRSVSSDLAEVELRLEWWSSEDRPIEHTVEITTRPETFDGAEQSDTVVVRLMPGRTESAVVIRIDDPQLWWTWDLGAQNLYRVSAAGVDTVFGIRTFERDPTTLVSHLNGRRIFLRGVWNAPTAFEASHTKRDQWRDVQMLREANGNLINVHGYVAGPEFYDAADRLGIVLFQQLPFHQFGPGGLVDRGHPRREPFSRQALAECTAVVRRVRGHASLMVWGAFAEARQDGRWWFGDYTDLSAAIEELVREQDVDAEYHASFCDFGETHLWQGAIGFGEFWDHNDHNAKFISEFGCPAPPVLESLRTFMAADALWNADSGHRGRLDLPIDAAAWSYIWGHEYEALTISVARILRHVDRDPPSLERFVDACGWYQWFAHRYCSEVYRRKRYADIAGIRMWSLRDASPGAKCAPLDYWQRPKMGLQGLREGYLPLQASIDERRPLAPLAAGSWWEREVWVVNDSCRDEELTVTAALVDPTGREIESRSWPISVAADAAVHRSVGFRLPQADGPYLVRVVGVRADGTTAVRSDNWLNVAPVVFSHPVRVLVLGQSRYNAPILDALAGVGGITLTVLDEVGRHPQDSGWAGSLAQDHDVVWFTGWERAVHAFTAAELAAVAGAVESGVGLIHTGGQGSFHGGDSLGPQLDATPMADVLPVVLRRNDTVWDLPPVVHDTGAASEFGISVAGLPSRGYSRTTIRDGCRTLATVDGYPLIAVGRHGHGHTVALTAALLPARRLLKVTEVETGDELIGVAPPWERADIREYSVHWNGNAQLFIGLLAAATGIRPAASPEQLADRLGQPIFELLAQLPAACLRAEIRDLTWNSEMGYTTGAVEVTNVGRVAARLVRGSIESADTMDTRFLDGFVDLLPNETTTLRFDSAAPPDRISSIAIAAQNCAPQVLFASS